MREIGQESQKNGEKNALNRNILYLCTDFLVNPMTIDQGDNGFAFLLYSLRRQISLLKERCTAAEAEVTALREAHRQQDEQFRALEEAHRSLTEKYEGLLAGTAQGASATEMRQAPCSSPRGRL